jgi:cytochrome c oxidase assembly protein subunit 15
MAIVFLLLTIISRAGMRQKVETSLIFRVVLIAGLFLLLFQILLGTQVREQVDEIGRTVAQRNLWISMIDAKILIHRSLSLGILVIVAWLYWRNFAADYDLFAIKVLFALTLIEVAAGAAMYYLSIPPFLQPIHIMLSTAMFASWVWAILRTRRTETKEVVSQYVS